MFWKSKLLKSENRMFWDWSCIPLAARLAKLFQCIQIKDGVTLLRAQRNILSFQSHLRILPDLESVAGGRYRTLTELLHVTGRVTGCVTRSCPSLQMSRDGPWHVPGCVTREDYHVTRAAASGRSPSVPQRLACSQWTGKYNGNCPISRNFIKIFLKDKTHGIGKSIRIIFFKEWQSVSVCPSLQWQVVWSTQKTWQSLKYFFLYCLVTW